jgi:hypothetical protein
VALRPLLSNYVNRLSAIAGNLINCAPVLNWLEVDNRGRRLYPPPPSDDADAEINTPAVAAAYAVRRYAAVASDEISFEVYTLISFTFTHTHIVPQKTMSARPAGPLAHHSLR